MKTKILSSFIDSTNYKHTYDCIKNFILTSKSPNYITVNNVHTIVEGVIKPNL